MSANKSQKSRLLRRDGLECHYCKKDCNPLSKVNDPMHPTIEHVIPRSRRGKDLMSNYVVACAGCNSKRGNEMFYCDCDWCAPLYAEYSLNEVRRMYMMERVRVRKNRHGRWTVTSGSGKRFFKSWNDALAAAMEMTRVEV